MSLKKETDNRFPRLCVASGLPMPVREYKFHDTRKWRLDYAWPEHKIGLEVNGGVWIRGRHTRGAGQIKDMEKFNAANLLSWHIYQCTPQEIHNLSILTVLQAAFKKEK